MEWTLINSSTEWEWYWKRLDVDGKYNHKHDGFPESYPCKVSSQFFDNPDGPYVYSHIFLYQAEKTCDKCGHKHKEWEV